MSEWRYVQKNEVQHESGFVLQLLAGDWSDPNDLSLVSPKNMSAADCARLLREGLVYAQANSYFSEGLAASASPTEKAKTEPRALGPNTLSLRKKSRLDA